MRHRDGTAEKEEADSAAPWIIQILCCDCQLSVMGLEKTPICEYSWTTKYLATPKHFSPKRKECWKTRKYLSAKRVLVKEYWYKGKPKYLGDGAEENGYGVHVATVAGGVLLLHKSYVYDHGKYPFIWRVCYLRENTIWGFGDIHQLKIPQIMLNKTDENIIEGLVHQTFGIKVFNTDAMSEKQKAVIRAKGTLPPLLSSSLMNGLPAACALKSCQSQWQPKRLAS